MTPKHLTHTPSVQTHNPSAQTARRHPAITAAAAMLLIVLLLPLAARATGVSAAVAAKAAAADTATCRVVVVDAETGSRVRGAVISCGSRRDTTAWDGTARMAVRFAGATVQHGGYLTRHLQSPLAADTIRLIPTAHRLAEVEVWGRRISKNILPHTEARTIDEQLLANQDKARGFNPLGLIAWGVQKLLPRHPKLTKREKLKIVLDNY